MNGSYMMTIYIMVKLLYLINAASQLFLLNIFVGDGCTLYGTEAIKDLLTGQTVEESPVFPRSSLCSFSVKNETDHASTHMIQCVLPINRFNEKIYLFLWFWLFFVTLTTFVSTISRVWNSREHKQTQFLELCINMAPSFSFSRALDKRLVQSFATKYLKKDGVLLLRLLGENVNDVILSDIVVELFFTFKETNQQPTVLSANLEPPQVTEKANRRKKNKK